MAAGRTPPTLAPVPEDPTAAIAPTIVSLGGGSNEEQVQAGNQVGRWIDPSRPAPTSHPSTPPNGRRVPPTESTVRLAGHLSRPHFACRALPSPDRPRSRSAAATAIDALRRADGSRGRCRGWQAAPSHDAPCVPGPSRPRHRHRRARDPPGGRAVRRTWRSGRARPRGSIIANTAAPSGGRPISAHIEVVAWVTSAPASARTSSPSSRVDARPSRAAAADPPDSSARTHVRTTMAIPGLPATSRQSDRASTRDEPRSSDRTTGSSSRPSGPSAARPASTRADRTVSPARTDRRGDERAPAGTRRVGIARPRDAGDASRSPPSPRPRSTR